MTNEKRHTPTPWEYGKAMNYDGFYIAPKGTLPTLAAVRHVGRNNTDITCFNFPGETEANAAFIVQAVNSYDRDQEVIKGLVEAAKFAERLMSPHGMEGQAQLQLRSAVTRAEEVLK